jgi:SWI/SNF-related matrix-associated actin-dependent regulator 1 of chromatin subfamily A
VAKLKRTLTIDKTDRPWMVKLRFPFHRQFMEFIKQFPGRTWVPEDKTWLMPSELVDEVAERARSLGWEVVRTLSLHQVPPYVKDPRLHSFQENAVNAALWEPAKRWIFAEDTGLGKTIEAITVMRTLKAERVLIVVPAMVRSKWEEELDQWWPEHPAVGRITGSLERKTGLSKAERARLMFAYAAPIKIVSYNLLPFVSHEDFDVIVFDEAHKLKEPTVDWSQRARALSERELTACVLALTATPASDKPMDILGVIEVVWPGRMGGVDPHYGLRKVAKERYAAKEESEYGVKYYGHNPVHSEELKLRLRCMMSRTTKRDVPELLPAFDVRYETIKAKVTSQILEHREILKHGWLEDEMRRTNEEKRLHASKWVLDALSAHSHVAVLTDRRESAKQIAAELAEKGVDDVFCITGAQTPEKRNELLAAAAERPSGVVVATMHSVGIGINLTFCTSALVAELCYRPEVLVQALGRFSRLSGTVPSSVTILSVEGTLDEVIANRVRDKIISINSAVEAGLGEKELADKLGMTGTWDEMLQDMLETEETGDEYDE